MVSAPIPIDFNIDNVTLDGKVVIVPKFVKAMVRITKILSKTKGKLVIIYPNYFCRYIPIIALGTGFEEFPHVSGVFRYTEETRARVEPGFDFCHIYPFLAC